MRFARRSPQELAFRLKQAIANLVLWAFPPSLAKDVSPAELSLPEPAKIRKQLLGSAFQAEIVSLADSIVKHELPMLGSTVSTGPEIEWRRDYIHGKSSGAGYFRFVPYLDFERAGDHKNIWELNRHQHLVVLAQAHLLTGEPLYVKEIRGQLESWWDQNPFLRGINWASALEVAFRALSWLWIDHLIGPSLDRDLRLRMWNSLYQHGAYLECNLSTYFSPNTHLLGEAVALHAIGVKLRQEKWRTMGAKTVEEELARQVQPDGSHFEQSTYYHLYALDFFLMHYLLAGRPGIYPPVLKKMAGFLSAIAGPERLLTFLGDDDGGRLFHPYGARDRFARATLSTCSLLFPGEQLPLAPEDLAEQAAWWLGCGTAEAVRSQGETRLFPNSGIVSITMPGTAAHILVDAGRFGFGGAGHSHADTLSITARSGSRELLIDPGTYTYMADPALRNAFRGTAFHNTIRIDELDQADPKGPFRWEGKPDVRVNQWLKADGMAFLDATCAYRGFEHRRRVLAVRSQVLLVLDEVTGGEREHDIEQFWHLGDRDVAILFSDPGAVQHEEGLRSRVLGQKESAPVLRAAWRTALPHLCGAAIGLHPFDGKDLLKRKGLELWIPGRIRASFVGSGMPLVSYT